jgi:hypothetical protein
MECSFLIILRLALTACVTLPRDAAALHILSDIDLAPRILFLEGVSAAMTVHHSTHHEKTDNQKNNHHDRPEHHPGHWPVVVPPHDILL